MNKRSLQKEQTREKILLAAHRLFAANGFATVNTHDISVEAEVSHGCIFVHFPTRSDLIIAVIMRFGEKIAARVHVLEEANHSLKTVLRAHVDIIKENESFYTQLLRDNTVLPREAIVQTIAIQSAVSHHIGKAAHKEIKKGKIMAIADDLLFNTWMALLHYYLTNKQLFVVSGSVMEKHGGKLLDHFMKLITIKTREA